MVSSVLAGALAARRSLFNQRVAEARHRWPGFDTAALSAFLTQTLDPVCVAVAQVDAAATLAVAETGFDIGLELVAQGLAGPAARLPWVDAAWQQLATPAAALIARAPLQVLGALSNAVVRMDSVPGVRVPDWIAAMQPLTARCTSGAQLRAAGALCAWQAGMVQLREAALAQSTQLPDDLVAEALGVAEGQVDAVRQQLQRERWWNPRTQAVEAQGQLLGGFTGLGGPFAAPPELRASALGFIARSGERHHLLLADAFGAVVLPASAAEFAAASAVPARAAVVDAQGVQIGACHVRFAAPDEGLQMMTGPAGIAIHSPYSHHVRVVPEVA